MKTLKWLNTRDIKSKNFCVCLGVCVCFQQVSHGGGREVSTDGGSPCSEEKETGWKGGLTAEHRRREPQAGAGRKGCPRGVTDTRNPREGMAAMTAREMEAGGHCQPHRHSLNTHRVDVEGPLSARCRVSSWRSKEKKPGPYPQEIKVSKAKLGQSHGFRDCLSGGSALRLRVPAA